MAAWNSIVRGNYIACQTQGNDPDPEGIVGEGNLLPTSQNRNAYVGIPQGKDSPTGPVLNMRPITVADLQAIPEPGPAGARGYTKKGDPFAGMGDF